MLKKFTFFALSGLLMASSAFGQYCIPDYTSDLSGDYVDDFTIVGPGVSFSNLNTSEPVGNYTDYTATFDALIMTAGNDYDVTVDCGPTWDQGIGVYIDLNFDEVFSADERLGCTLVDAGTGGATYTITIPAGSTPGATRMRVMADYADNCTASMNDMASCAITSSFGEAEDYAVEIVAGDDCAGTPEVSAASSTAASTCASDEFTVSITAIVGGGISYQWWSSADGVSYSEIVGATGASYTTTQTDATYYQCEVTCAASGESAVSDAVYVDNVCPGCTDETSVNYNAEANEDDGTCFYGYTVSDCDYESSFMAVPDGSATLSLSDDAVSGAVGIGFDFTFFGSNFSELYVASNGLLSFNSTTDNGCCTGETLPSASYSHSIYFHQEDLDPNSGLAGTISYWTEGAAGSQIFVLDFTNVPHYPDATGPLVSVQVQLHQATGEVKIVTTEFNQDASTVTTLGINTTDYDGVAYWPEGHNAAEYASEFETCYSFMPVDAGETCDAVTGLTATPSGTSGTLSWDDAGATKYRFAVATAAGPVANGQTTSLSRTFSGLIPGETYTARVARDCYPDGWSATSTVIWTMPLRIGQVGTEVSIYPNPSNGVFRIQLNGYSGTSMDLQIVNMVGQVVYHNMINVMDDVTAEEIDLSNVPAGTYMVRLTNGEEVSLQTIVIE